MVWLEQQGVYALPRYDEVRATLADDATFRTGDGVSLNTHYNGLIRGSTFASDGQRHTFLRGLVANKLTPRALRPMRGRIEETATSVVDEVLAAGVFDSVNELARKLVLAVVPDFIGVPADCHDDLIDWAAANFNCHGPMNERAQASMAVAGRMAAYATRLVDERTARPGGLAHCVLDAMDDGAVDRDQAISLMIDYLVPSLDTTVTGLATAIWLFARHPDQWDMLRAEPSLLGMAFNEVVRFETPVRQFGRRVARDTEIAGVPIPRGAQVLVMFASANRDERKWDRPDVFDITRNPVDHVGFGYGAHGCAGQGLARLEAQAALAALARRVTRFEVTGETRTVNNLMRAFDSMPTRVHTD
ncbi:cytochrome P450 [Nocardia cyriacigeorgica]|uniref:cytochrome P450 n=1 Tax=Nocardia cyriacigeorgica TaxID=135487 RepID=UPI002456D528|nr:cytochrome P450 [Nocardia cyriacigeorgica]